jgi:hypothetical protein
LAVQKWWSEVAKEQGATWLNEQYQFGVSGYALYGEITINAGYPLSLQDYLLAGIQTNPNDSGCRVAKIDGLTWPGADGKPTVAYFTSTYYNMPVVMGLDTSPYEDS